MVLMFFNIYRGLSHKHGRSPAHLSALGLLMPSVRFGFYAPRDGFRFTSQVQETVSCSNTSLVVTNSLCEPESFM